MKRSTNNAVSCFSLVTDFGPDSLYLGQMHAVLVSSVPHVPVINLLSDAPAFNAKATAYLLCALSKYLPDHTLFLCVIDPGVGSERMGLILETDNHLFIGPDNGLLSQVARRANKCKFWRISNDYKSASPTFHGRDIFASVAASLVNNEQMSCEPIPAESIVGWRWPENLHECIYIDRYGNLFTGIGGDQVSPESILRVGSERISFARTFSTVLPGSLFWYVNSCGLIEVAANMARASDLLGVGIGDAVVVEAG